MDHPDIMSFIRCKKQEGKITNFNLSVSITDAFMNSVMSGGVCSLKDPETGEIVREIPARDLFSEIIENTWTNGEPGVIFIDTINDSNPAPEAFKIEATNPCVTENTVVQTFEGSCCVKDLIGVSFRTIVGDQVPGGFFPTRSVTELVKITTERGFSITCTPNHRLHTVMGWEQAENLKPRDDALMMLMGSQVSKEHAYKLSEEQDGEAARIGWTIASGNYIDDSDKFFDEESCKRKLDTTDIANTVCILRNCWMYSGRPEGKIMIGNCSEATAQSLHLCLLRMGLMTRMIPFENYWEFVPINRHAIPFQCIICCDRDMTEAIHVAVVHAQKIYTLSKMERDIVAKVERIVVPDTVVYDATCQDPTEHILYTDGFLSHNCGEIPLHKYESCCLGSVNLRNHVSDDGNIDWDRLEKSVRISVDFLNDVIDVNGFVPSVPKLKEMAHTTRRIGLGIMGLADMFFRLRVRYGSMDSISVASQVMEFIRFTSMQESVLLSKQDGPFPAYYKTKYLSGTWETPTRLDTEKYFGVPYVERDIGRPSLDWGSLRQDINQYGIRNIATTAVAPTGTLSLASGVSGFGCEPVFGLVHRRRIISRQDGQIRYQTMMVSELKSALQRHGMADGAIEEVMEKIKSTGSCKGIEEVPKSISDIFVCAADVTVKEHVMMQAALQRFVDGAISKTVNMPPGSTRDDVRETFINAWKSGCKGICVYISGSRATEVLSTGSK